MVILSIELNEFRSEVGAYAGEDDAKVVENGLGEDLAPIFRHEDQMYMHQEDAVSTASNIVFNAHRPRV